MEIKTDEEGTKAIHALCDAALKLGGLTAYNLVSQVCAALNKKEE